MLSFGRVAAPKEMYQSKANQKNGNHCEHLKQRAFNSGNWFHKRWKRLKNQPGEGLSTQSPIRSRKVGGTSPKQKETGRDTLASSFL